MNMQLENIANLTLGINGRPTIRGYLHKILIRLWREKEEFSGKRPLGNSCWEYPIYEAMIKAKVVRGELDEYGGVVDVDMKKADKLIEEMIWHIFFGELE